MFSGSTLSINSPFYPECLKQYSKLNDIKYVGNFTPADLNSVAIIGTRECTRYGRKVAGAVANYLLEQNITIISGLSYGIEECVLRTVLSRNGRVIGITGVCPSNLSPFSQKIGTNLALKMQSINNSVLIYFNNLEENPSKDSYIYRNVLVAAFAKVLVIIEAGKSSYTSSAVDAALDFGKNVFAVPGSIFSEKSAGTHQMIKEGAYLLEDLRDIKYALD